MKTKRLSNWLVIFSLALLCVSLLAGRPRADDFPVPAAPLANLPTAAQEPSRAQVQPLANAAYQRLLLKLDEANRVCGLTGQQRMKLGVAAKGAVDHALTKWIDTNSARLGANASGALDERAARQQAMQNQLQAQRQQLEAQQRQAQLALRAMQRPVAPAGAKGVNPEDAKARLAEREALARQQKALLAQQQALEQQVAQLEQNAAALQAQPVPAAFGGAARGGRGGRGGGVAVANSAVPDTSNDLPTLAEQEKTWTVALDSILTEKQRAQITAVAAERSAFQPQTAAERVMAEVDRQLLLDRAQREKLAGVLEKAVEQNAGDELLRRNPNQLTTLTKNVLRAVPEDQLKSILSEPQLAQRTQLLARPTAPPRQVNSAEEGIFLNDLFRF